MRLAERSPLAEIAVELARRYQGVVGCIAYGSCLRSADVFDGLSDFYVIVGDYLQAYRAVTPSLLNWLIPPNVYYAEFELPGGTARVKYAVLSLADLGRGCERRFESYVWGRFAQPVGLFGFEDAQVLGRVEEALQGAAARLIDETFSIMPDEFSSHDLWVKGLARSYATELRAEKSSRIGEIVAHAPGHYERLAQHCLTRRHGLVAMGEGRWRRLAPASLQTSGRYRWLIRRILGKPLSLLRLLKAYFTFRDGIDYLAWKLSRHSGVEIEVPERVRRWPLIFGWTFFARLYRSGVFE